jgi:hypothetical protein
MTWMIETIIRTLTNVKYDSEDYQQYINSKVCHAEIFSTNKICKLLQSPKNKRLDKMIYER